MVNHRNQGNSKQSTKKVILNNRQDVSRGNSNQMCRIIFDLCVYGFTHSHNSLTVWNLKNLKTKSEVGWLSSNCCKVNILSNWLFYFIFWYELHFLYSYLTLDNMKFWEKIVKLKKLLQLSGYTISDQLKLALKKVKVIKYLVTSLKKVCGKIP